MLHVYYFSGTGNAKAVAQWLQQVWVENGQLARVNDIAELRRETRTVERGEPIALVSPTHGFNFPPVTLSFVRTFPRTSHRNQVLLFNTRAGVRLLGLPIPGLSGAAQWLSALLFLVKGYRVRVMRPVDLPSNWISLHPGLRKDNVQALFTRCEAQVRKSAKGALDGRRDLRALYDLPIDLALTPISVAYYVIGRFVFAKSFYASAGCDVCGLCIKQCPIHAIKLVGGRPFWTYRCESCMRCMNQCPKLAIQTAHGFVIGLLALLSALGSRFLYSRFETWIPVAARRTFGGVSLWTIVENFIVVLVLFGTYRTLHWALRFRAVERLVVMTSLTHFRFWRRYRAPKIKP
jgi:ferredoxin